MEFGQFMKNIIDVAMCDNDGVEWSGWFMAYHPLPLSPIFLMKFKGLLNTGHQIR